MADNVDDSLFSEVPFDNRQDFDNSFQMEITDLEGAGIQSLTNVDDEQFEDTAECEEALATKDAEYIFCEQQRLVADAENETLNEALDAILIPPTNGTNGCYVATGTFRRYYAPENCYETLSGNSVACLTKTSTTVQRYDLTISNSEDYSADCPSPLIGTGINWSITLKNLKTGGSLTRTPPIGGSQTWSFTFSPGDTYSVTGFFAAGSLSGQQELGTFFVPSSVTQDLTDKTYLRTIAVDEDGNVI